MAGPRNQAEAEYTKQRLTEMRNSHAFYCDTCIHVKYCKDNPCGHMPPCEVAGIYNRSIAAAALLVELAKGPEGNVS